MGCGGSKVDGEEGEDDIDVPDDIPRTHSQVTGVGMDFFGDLNAELVRPTPMRHLIVYPEMQSILKLRSSIQTLSPSCDLAPATHRICRTKLTNSNFPFFVQYYCVCACFPITAPPPSSSMANKHETSLTHVLVPPCRKPILTISSRPKVR